MATQQLAITWLYARTMNIYGDRGNVIALQQRAGWRGIEVTTTAVGIGDPLPERSDIVFFGGGQDQAQVDVARDLQGAKGEAITAAVDAGAALLAICGGYQLLGREYRPHDAAPIPGTGLFAIESEAGPERFIGNVVVESGTWGQLVGFENHSGLTFLDEGLEPMGTVVVGRGNNGRDGTEGARYRNALGCYMHGALLPKNPRLTDWLIEAGLRYRYGDVVPLVSLEGDIEGRAHATAVERARATR